MPYTKKDADLFNQIMQTGTCGCGVPISNHATTGIDGYDASSMRNRPARCCVLTQDEIPAWFGPPRMTAVPAQ